MTAKTFVIDGEQIASRFVLTAQPLILGEPVKRPPNEPPAIGPTNRAQRRRAKRDARRNGG